VIPDTTRPTDGAAAPTVTLSQKSRLMRGFRRSSALCSSLQSKSTGGGSDFHSYNERERAIDAAASRPPWDRGRGRAGPTPVQKCVLLYPQRAKTGGVSVFGREGG